MTVPDAIQQLVEKAIGQVRQDSSHQLRLFLRCQLYDAFRVSSPGERALTWLGILTARFVLPLWKEEKLGSPWDDYPTPAQLVDIHANRLRGNPISEEDNDAINLADEMVSLTGEHARSPIFPTWCVFEVAVRLNWTSSFSPDEHITDADVIAMGTDEYRDVAHLALVAYAGRIQTEIDDISEMLSIWEAAEYDTSMSLLYPEPGITPPSLPWTLTLDAAACLKFWEWWLLKAVPEAWQQATHHAG